MKAAVLLVLAVAAVAQTSTAPVLIRKTAAQYTTEAQQKRIEGAVVLTAEIGTDGRAHRLHIIRSLGAGLDENAVAAVRQWRFRPGTKNGVAVATQSTIEVEFRLHNVEKPDPVERAVRV